MKRGIDPRQAMAVGALLACVDAHACRLHHQFSAEFRRIAGVLSQERRANQVFKKIESRDVASGWEVAPDLTPAVGTIGIGDLHQQRVAHRHCRKR